MRKMSERRGRQSLRKARKIRFSPFWLKSIIPEIMVECGVSWAHCELGRMGAIEGERGGWGLEVGMVSVVGIQKGYLKGVFERGIWVSIPS
jgi:hypothetical protein